MPICGRRPHSGRMGISELEMKGRFPYARHLAPILRTRAVIKRCVRVRRSHEEPTSQTTPPSRRQCASQSCSTTAAEIDRDRVEKDREKLIDR